MRSKFFLTASLLFASSGLRAGADVRLVEAAHNGDRSAIQSLLTQGVAVNAVAADGTAALHWVVRADDLEVAELLIKAGADVHARNRRGVTPLDLACLNGSAAMIEKLLAAGADANVASPDGQTPLMIAARTGNPEAVAALLGHGVAVNAKETVAQQTALMAAVTENHADVVRLLIARGADVNARTATTEAPPATVGNLQGIGRAQNREKPVPQGGLTALLYASRDGNLEIARMLVAGGAAVDQGDANGTSALLLATINGNVEVAKFLLEKGANPSAADGTLLDHSMILYGSAMSDGNKHNHDPLPIVLAGGATGQLKGGRHLRFAQHTTMSNLLLAMLDKLGASSTRFGVARPSWRFDEGIRRALVASSRIVTARLQLPWRPAPRLSPSS